MLVKKHRLRKNEVAVVFKRGRRFFVQGAIVLVLTNDLPFARLAFVVSKKVTKQAHQRNYLKRIYRAAASSFLKDLTGYDCVIMIQDANTDYVQCLANLKHLSRLLNK